MSAAARPWIAYVGPVAFPEGGAAARRILGNAQALADAGHDVTIVSGQTAATADKVFDVTSGVTCVSTGERDAEHLPKVLRHARYLTMGAKSRRWLGAQTQPPAAIILYSGYAPYLLQLTGWARRRGIPILFDAVEWYTAPGPLGLVASPYHWNIELAMRVLIPRTDGVIAISRALESYYAQRGLPVLRVPPLLDCAALPESDPARPDGPLRLAYSGSPGRNKDLMDTVIAAVIAADGGQGRLVLDIAGLSAEDVRRRLGGPPPACIRAHGQLPQARVAAIVGAADFSLFLRRINRVSTHGFPTKFVESLGLGTPVITNLTGDLADHLRPGETGLVCDGPGEAALRAELDTALALEPAARTAMRHAARAEAARAFDYRVHAGAFGDFLRLVRQRTQRKETGR